MMVTYLLIVIMLVLGAYMTRKIDLTGAITGGILTFMLLIGIEWLGLWLIGGFFVSGTWASVWKLKEKQQLGLAEKNKARRSVSNVLANALIPGFCGFLACIYPEKRELLEILTAAGFASATSDTLSSELGNVYGTKYVNSITMKKAERGKDGVVSLEGSLFGLAGSAIITLVYITFRGLTWDCLLIFCAGILGNWMDSILGATLQQRAYMNNFTVNLANTLFATLLAYGIYTVFMSL